MKTAFPINSTPVSIRLYSNIPFDNTYKHHSLISELFTYDDLNIYSASISSRIAKERFIDRINWGLVSHPYYYPRYDLTGEFNFDFSNGLIGSVVLELAPAETNANYMRVKVGTSLSGYEYYYYFVTGITQINADTYRLSLELDVLMTYQNEFLSGMKDIPVFTSRKHCHRYTDDGKLPCCADLKTGDEVFSGVKPSIIQNIYSLQHNSSTINNIKDVVWLYICMDCVEDDYFDVGDKRNWICQGIHYPFAMLVVPLNCDLTIKDANGNLFGTFTKNDIGKCICDVLISDGKIHGAKLSNYPPFTGGNVSLSGGVLTIQALTSTGTTDPEHPALEKLDFTVGSDTDSASRFFVYGNYWEGNYTLKTTLHKGFLLLMETKSINYLMSVDASFKQQFINTTIPSVTSNRYLDPKLLFSPFKKYMLGSKYTADGSEIYPELLFSEFVTSTEYSYFTFNSIHTPYIADMSVFTFLKAVAPATYDYAFNGYDISRIGLSGTMNYTMPVGENALEVFKSTQQNAFYQSKVASGITGGLSIVGGVGSIALGVAGLVGSYGMSAPMSAGLIAGGAGAIASGTAGVANAIKSASAKIEDLKNTPDSVNVAGSTFISDNGIDSRYNKIPFISVYNVSSVIQENANDFFYNYGYQVARECYFNTELKYTSTNHATDNNLFGRTIFNYIQTNDDLTNKINANIPLIIKQKLNSIFNNGITLWSWFGFDELWGQGVEPVLLRRLDKWFLKCTLDNTEYKQ